MYLINKNKTTIFPLYYTVFGMKEKSLKDGVSRGPHNSGDAQKAPGYGILAIILSKTSYQVFYRP